MSSKVRDDHNMEHVGRIAEKGAPTEENVGRTALQAEVDPSRHKESTDRQWMTTNLRKMILSTSAMRKKAMIKRKNESRVGAKPSVILSTAI